MMWGEGGAQELSLGSHVVLIRLKEEPFPLSPGLCQIVRHSQWSHPNF